MRPGDVLKDSLTGYRALAPYLVPLSLLANAALIVYSILLVVLLGDWGLVGATVVSLVGLLWLNGLLVQTIDDLQNGDGLCWIGDRARRLWPRLNTLSIAALIVYALPFFGLVLIYSVHPAVGFVLLIAGLLLLVRWCLAVPVVMLEETRAVEALKRSNELVRGYSGRVFWALLVSGILAGVIERALDRLLVAIFEPSVTLALVSNLLIGALAGPFYALILTVLYYRLRGLDEQPEVAATPVPSE